MSAVKLAVAVLYGCFNLALVFRNTILEKCIYHLSFATLGVVVPLTWIHSQVNAVLVALILFGIFCLLPLILLIQMIDWRRTVLMLLLSMVYPTYLIIKYLSSQISNVTFEAVVIPLAVGEVLVFALASYAVMQVRTLAINEARTVCVL